MRWSDELRIERTVALYDFWLDVHDVSRRRRRDLRRELRANLSDSAALLGAREAVRALGGTRAMAADVTSTRRSDGPRWLNGLALGVLAAALSLTAFLFTALAWADGVLAVDPATAVRGTLTFWPSSSLALEPSGAGLSMSFAPGWLPWAAAAAVFLVGSRVWRVLRRPGGAPPSVAA